MKTIEDCFAPNGFSTMTKSVPILSSVSTVVSELPALG